MIESKKAYDQLFKVIDLNKTVRNAALKSVEKAFWIWNINKNVTNKPKEIQKTKFYEGSSIIYSLLRNYDKGYISKDVLKRIYETLYNGAFFSSGQKAKDDFHKKYGIYPPNFITLSPSKVCNLHCKGCYASSTNLAAEKLPYKISKKILQEAHDDWGNRFFVISGGEPFMYRTDDNKTILDLASEFKDSYFLIYTNGTLIDKKTANRIAELGNITTAISVEGYEKETDDRRGANTYARVLQAMDNLRSAGVPFGLSITATRNNAEILTDWKFYDYYFQELGVSYMWIFQYMPIGRGFNIDLMPTPEQRFEMLKMWEKCIKEKHYFVADFWNSATVSDGCIAYGRGGGYIYIDWNGNIMPCVFVPYHKDNILDIYRNGGTITDALFSDFFVNGRKWQKKYGYGKKEPGNWLMPCSIRDNYKDFRNEVITDDVIPEDKMAEKAMNDSDYYNKMIDYDDRYRKITEEYWQKRFIGKKN
ncbi:MAG: radical SAM protein [Proteobacteria bacterium]|nr:radical SAM protein [Pseudomonadota bacterium]